MYSEAIRQITESSGVLQNELGSRLDCVFSDTPVFAFVRWYVDTFGKGVVVSPEIGARTISLDLRQSTGAEIMQMAARVLGVGSALLGNTYYLGAVDKTDSAVYVTKVTRLQKPQIEGIVRMLLSGTGAIQALDNGVAIITDVPEVLTKVERTLNDLESVQSDCWVVQLLITEGSQTLSEMFGLAGTPEIGISAVINSNLFGSASGSTDGQKTQSGAAQTQVNLSAVLDSALYANRARGAFSAVYAPMVISLDGEPVTMHSGRTYRYQKFTTSQYGVSSADGISSVTDGLQLNMLVRESGREDAILDLSLSLSTVEGELNGLPVTAERTLKTRAQVRSGGFYVLGRLEYENISRNKSVGVMQWLKDHGRTDQRVYVFARVYRIQSLKGEFATLAGGSAAEGGR